MVLREGVTSVGRDSDNDLQLMSEFVSRHHAKLNTTQSVCEVEDLDSANSTFVNGEKVTVYQLNNGDEICFGDFVFRFEECLYESSEDLSVPPVEYSDRTRHDTVRIKKPPVTKRRMTPEELEKCKSTTQPIPPLRLKS